MLRVSLVLALAAAAVPGPAAAGEPDEAVVRRPAISAAGWTYLPHERTYRGLPVIGGDFVQVVAPSGRVTSTSAAPHAPIGHLDVHPKLTRSAAEQMAARSGAVKGSRLVVDATGGTARLAWETVAGQRTVEVDAVTGAILRTTDNVLDDIGHAALNGGEVNVADALINCPTGDCPNQHTWILAYPSGGGLSCDAPVVHRTDPEPLVWGHGDPTDAETACVDAMFDSDIENAMLTDWLGRNGLRNLGPHSGFPIFTDGNEVSDSFYQFDTPVQQAEVHIGRSPNGVWWASLDVVGHENGHGVDDHTPGGLSGGGTPEFIADAFGVATEWYANGQAPYDTPDYVLIDTPAMAVPDSLKRFMYDPHLNGHTVNCFSPSVPSLDAHDAAGVGDHWLYLLAEGSNPTDGQPASPTCNGGAVGGVSLRRAMQILYHAMLMKTSASSYPNYRLWTLTAANNLFPGDCATLSAVRKAWDAVSVPVQPGEPSACVPGVVGAARTDAVNAITAAGLVLGTVTEQGSNATPGTVLAQTPAGGSVVTEGSAVNITVAAFVVTVPNVVGRSRNDAVDAIRAAGLTPSVSFVKECVNPQAVLSQSPVGGSSAIRGQTVRLTVDNGTIKTCRGN